MAVAGREHAAGHENREVQLGAGCQVPRVDVARALGRGQDIVPSGLVGGHAHGSAEGRDRDVDVVAQLGRGPVAKVEIADAGVGKVRGQQSQARKQGGPPPRTRLEAQDLHLEDVAGLGTLDEDRTAKRVELVEVECSEPGGVVAFLQLTGGHLLGVEVDDVARLDLDRRRQRVVPLVVEGVMRDRVLPYASPCHHFLTTGAALSLMGAALARKTFLSNLPTEVLGTSSMNRTSSGSHHLATLSRRKSMISSCVTLPLNSGLATAYATGRSSHFGCARPITAASRIFGCDMIAFSSSTEEIHSPPDLMTSLVRSTICM